MKKVVVFVSSPEAGRVRQAIAITGGNRLGNYSESVAHAFASAHNSLRVVDEEKFEFACDDDTYAAVLAAIDGIAPRHSATVDSWSMETY